MSNDTHELNIKEIQPGRIHLIEANAGTGKTYAIANLFLRYILEGRKVQQLLVVTFARDATDELRGRIRSRLVEARKMLQQGQAPDNVDDFFSSLPDAWTKGEKRQQALNNLKLALLEINEAAIYTIHAFCQKTLSEMAFSSGQTFDLEQADDGDLKRRAMQDWWRKRTYGLENTELAVFQTFLPNIKCLENCLKILLGSPTIELYPSPTSDIKTLQKKFKDTLNNLKKSWREEHATARELLLDEKFPLNRNRHQYKSLVKHLNALDTSLLLAFSVIPKKDSLKAISISNFTYTKYVTIEDKSRVDKKSFTYAEELRELLDGSSEQLLLHELDDAHKFVRDQLKLTKQRLGRISFDDMIERLHHALLNNEQTSRVFADQLCQRHPVIMVDEFQDTDSLQYAIFKRIHQADSEHTLILIGDPKQAIYGFRGGDIFTYMQACHEADQYWNLSVNWRSTEETIQSINTLFSGSNPFAYTDIPYNPSQYPEAGNSKAQPLIIDAQVQTALRIENLPLIDGERIGDKDTTERLVHMSVAGRIAELLQPGKARIGDRPLQAADIAILVSEHQQGKAVREALLKRSVRAVTAGKDSIWETTETRGLQRLLEAALLPTDRNLLRQAIAEDMLNLRYNEIHTLITDTRRWGRWVNLLAETGNRWRNFGYMSGFYYLLQGLSKALETDEATDWLDRVVDPERTLTNLLHLADLLQTANREHATGEQLLAWMTHQKNVAYNEDLELRLESDENLVKIITVHKSKGLQYPVVFVPYLWSCKDKRRANSQTTWHKQVNNGFRHLYAPEGCKEGCAPEEHERLAEDIRKVYVALTRAESHCHLFMGSAGNAAGRTALSWLLSAQDIDLEQHAFEINKDDVSTEALKNKAHIEVVPAAEYDGSLHVVAATAGQNMLQTTSFKRRLRINWRVGSFSAMTRDTHQTTHALAATGSERFALRYPAGANIGNFLHALLEHLEPETDLQPQIEQMTPWLFRRYGILENEIAHDLGGLGSWMRDVLNTPLDNNNLTLGGLDHNKVLRELDFDLSTGLVQADRINELLGHDSDEIMPLQFDDFQGMLTGVIDLVFEHKGRFYIADYKSNLLGRRLEDYTPDILIREIVNRRYDLQYLIYTLALHRHLQQRIPDYDYQHHFGGVYYLFLRAMRPQTGNDYGIYFTRPDYALIRRLDEDIFTFKLEKTA